MKNRRGAFLLEITMALALATAAMVALAQLMVFVAHQRRETERTRIAAREVANLMERVMILPWEQVTPDHLSRLQISDETQRRLASAELRIFVDEGAGDDHPQGLRQREVRIVLTWRDAAGLRVQPVELSAWRFAAAQSATD
jgi:hypothetical protein